MSYYSDLMREAAALCLTVGLGEAEGFATTLDRELLSPTEYIAVLRETATRIGGCANYDPAASFAAASRLTEHAMEAYDPGSGDQTLDLMSLVTNYMDYPRESFPQGREEAGRAELFEVWLSIWARAEASISPRWDENAVFQPFDDPRVRDGQSPEGIADPDLRAAYEDHLARKQAFQANHRDQLLLRRALDRYRDDYVDYARTLPGLKSDTAQTIADPTLKAALQDAAARP